MHNILQKIAVSILLMFNGFFGIHQDVKAPVVEQNLGASVLTVPQGGSGASTLTGCLTGNGTAPITGSGSPCGAGGSSAFEIATTSDIGVSQFAYFTKTGGITTLASISTSSLANWILPFTSYGASTSTTLGLLNGFFSTASSTLSGNTYLPALSQGILYTGTNGKVGTTATSSFSLSQFTNDLANLTAGDTTLTFSGAYNGSSARTVTANCVAITGSADLCDGSDASGASASAFEIATTSDITAPGFTYFTKTSGKTTLGSVSTSTLSQYLFPNTSYGASTSTIIGFLGGLFSPASTTLSGNTYHPNLTQGFNYIGTNGLISTISTSTLASHLFTFNSYGMSTTTIPGFLNGFFAVGSSTIVGNATTTGTHNFGVASATTAYLGTGQGSLYVGTGGKVNSTATSSIANGTGVTVTNGSTSYVLGAQPTINCNTASASVFGCLNASDFSKFNSATTTFSTGLTYTLGTNAVTLTAPVTIALGGTNSTAVPITNSIMVFNGTGIVSTTTQPLYVGSLQATSSLLNSVFLNNWNGFGTTTPRYALQIASSTKSQLQLQGSDTDTGIAFRSVGNFFYLASTSPTTFATTSASNLLAIDLQNDFIGIGTSTPKFQLQISTSSQPQLALTSGAGDMGYGLRSVGGSLYIASTSDTTFATTSVNSIAISAGSSASSGLLIGTSTLGSTGLSVVGTVFAHTLTTAAGTPSSICMNATTKEITVNAALTCTVSDEEQKSPLNKLDFSALEMVMKLQPSSFTYNDRPDRLRYGFGAQSLQKIDPRLGDAYDKDGIARSIDLPALIALNTKAIQELNTKVDNIQNPQAKKDWFIYFLIGALIGALAYQQVQISRIKNER